MATYTVATYQRYDNTDGTTATPNKNVATITESSDDGTFIVGETVSLPF
ncbi:hypothetical protein [Nioella aestuarii]